MTIFSDQKLIDLNHLGLIPGPHESADEFVARADYCLNLQEHLSEEFKASLGSVKGDSIEKLKQGFDVAASAYGIRPAWIPIFFSNYKLPPWHGGCAWIFQMTDHSPTAALLQLRQSLYQSPKYLGLYHRDELVAHELAHVGRMKFEESQFEEILAYRTSASRFGRWFGPIVQSSYESMFFVLALAIIVFIDVFLLAFYNYEAYLSASWLKAIPISMICFALVRLGIRQFRFKRSYEKLQTCLKDPHQALSVLYRLTDREISDFSTMETEEIMTYASEKAGSCLRWQLIFTTYLKC